MTNPLGKFLLAVLCLLCLMQFAHAEVPEELISAAKSGDANAQFELANLYAEGDGIEQDAEKAIQLYMASAEHGNAEAQFVLAMIMFSNPDTPGMLQQGESWLRESAKQGDVEAQYYLGSWIAEGRVSASQEGEAIDWLESAAEKGHADAQYNLGAIYAQGEGVEEDWAIAVQWYSKAALQGHIEAQNNLGVAYALGKGVKKDLTKAYIWFSVAAVAGHEVAKSQRNRISEELGTVQLTSAQEETKTILERIGRDSQAPGHHPQGNVSYVKVGGDNADAASEGNGPAPKWNWWLITAVLVAGLVLAAFFIHRTMSVDGQEPSFGLSLLVALLGFTGVGILRALVSTIFGSQVNMYSAVPAILLLTEIYRRMLLSSSGSRVPYGKALLVALGSMLIVAIPFYVLLFAVMA